MWSTLKHILSISSGVCLIYFLWTISKEEDGYGSCFSQEDSFEQKLSSVWMRESWVRILWRNMQQVILLTCWFIITVSLNTIPFGYKLHRITHIMRQQGRLYICTPNEKWSVLFTVLEIKQCKKSTNLNWFWCSEESNLPFVYLDPK